MKLTMRDISILNEIAMIGRSNTSMKEVASSLGISYGYLMRRKAVMARNNGYATFQGLLVDYVKEICGRHR